MRHLLRPRRLLASGVLRPRYDVVIVGGGGHGLSTAYYLAARHGVRDVVVLERSYIGSGATGRNTTIVRCNYMNPETIAFYRRSCAEYEQLSAELGFNLLHSRRGVLDVVHTHDGLAVERRRVQMNRALGVDTQFVSAEEIAGLCPQIDLSAGGRPVLGGSYHPPGSIVRHDAVVWGYAAAAARHGVDVRQGIEVTGLLRSSAGACVGVQTTAGPIRAGIVLSAVAGNTSALAEMAGLRLPLRTQPLQAFVTEPYKPALDLIVGSNDLLVYVSQSARGEFLVGAEVDPYQSYSTGSTLGFLSHASARAAELLPLMRPLRILRQWGGVCDMTPDYSPLLGETDVSGFYLSAGWGTWGFKAIPAGGLGMAELLATGRCPPLLASFGLDRFSRDAAISERASAGTH